MQIQTPSGIAELSTIDENTLQAHRTTWAPCLAAEDDEFWDWSIFVDGSETEYGFESGQFLEHFSLWADGRLQALMVISGEHICVASENASLTAVYVEYIAVAPWNRPDVRNRGLCVEHARGAGVGSTLFSIAIKRSRERNLGGRVAWHSVPRAEQDYKAMLVRMCGSEPIDCGVDAGSGHRLFEISAEIASAWPDNRK